MVTPSRIYRQTEFQHTEPCLNFFQQPEFQSPKNVVSSNNFNQLSTGFMSVSTQSQSIQSPQLIDLATEEYGSTLIASQIKEQLWHWESLDFNYSQSINPFNTPDRSS